MGATAAGRSVFVQELRLRAVAFVLQLRLRAVAVLQSISAADLELDSTGLPIKPAGRGEQATNPGKATGACPP